MTQTARKSASISRSIRGIPLEIQKRIRIFSAARGLKSVDFFEQYMTKLMEYLGSESPDISVAASIVMGSKIYPYQKNEGGRDIWSIRIREAFSEMLFKFGHATTGSVESFIRESMIQFGKRLPPSDQIISGFNRRMERAENGREKVAYYNWDGHVDVAQDTPEGDREL